MPRTPSRPLTRALTALVVAVVGCLVVVEPAAHATTGDIGYLGRSYKGAVNPPTSDKPQSKLWFNDGLWWATMFDSASLSWHIFRLNRATETWVDTGTRVDDRPQTLSDALWDGTRLYVASQYATVNGDASPTPSLAAPARLYRYSYSSATQTYTLDAGFPTVISNDSSESLTIDKDTTGRIWATWTKVTGSSTAGYTNTVYVNSSADGLAWGTPMVLPASGTNPTAAPDDISAVVAFGRSKVGVLWSNHRDDSVYWATHNDGDPVGTWKGSIAVRGTKQPDDHMNLKTIDADSAGRVVAAVKTSLDELSTSKSTDPQVNLLVFRPGTGSWTSTVVGTLADCHTRPQVMLDSANNEVHVFATAPTQSGCPYAGAPGTIYEKTASLDNPSFAPGRGTPVIRDAASENVNNVTSTKQSVTSSTGLVVLASNNSTKRYWHADIPLRSSAPTAAFTTSASTGTAPMTVQLTDTSTGSPTGWSWDLGNGTTSTQQNPSVTYTTPGTYTVSLTASNATGTSAPTTKTITVTAGAVAPTAAFTTSASTGTAPMTVQLTDTSTGSPTGWSWDLGNGTTSTQQNPSVTYTTPGTYTVSLTASNATGTSAPTTKTITVTAPTSRTITLDPVADTMVKQASAGTSYGSATSLQTDTEDISGNTSSSVRSYLRFSVPALAPGESVSAAKLSLNLSNGTANGPGLYRTATSWDESTMTWTTGRPARSSSTAVGNFGSMALGRATTPVSGITSSGDVSLELSPESSDGMDFDSREASTTANRPQLVLTISSS